MHSSHAIQNLIVEFALMDKIWNQGVTRLSFMHYNTLEEVERVVDIIKAACSWSWWAGEMLSSKYEPCFLIIFVSSYNERIKARYLIQIYLTRLHEKHQFYCTLGCAGMTTRIQSNVLSRWKNTQIMMNEWIAAWCINQWIRCSNNLRQKCEASSLAEHVLPVGANRFPTFLNWGKVHEMTRPVHLRDCKGQ